MTKEPFAGPLEQDGPFPDVLTGRVVTPGEQPRIQGYEVEADLARHYGVLETAFLALTGELPNEKSARALNVALVFIMAVPVNEAPSHVAALARLSGARDSAMIGAAAIALAEQTRVLLDEHVELLEWLRQPSGSLPSAYRSKADGERLAVEQLRAALPEGYPVPGLVAGATRQAAVLAVLFSCGLRRRSQLEAMLVFARLPTVLAEGLSERATAFQRYPINLPRFEYRSTP